MQAMADTANEIVDVQSLGALVQFNMTDTTTNEVTSHQVELLQVIKKGAKIDKCPVKLWAVTRIYLFLQSAFRVALRIRNTHLKFFNS